MDRLAGPMPPGHVPTRAGGETAPAVQRALADHLRGALRRILLVPRFFCLLLLLCFLLFMFFVAFGRGALLTFRFWIFCLFASGG